MPPKEDKTTESVSAWIEYIEKYLPDEAERLERLRELDPSTLGEYAGRRAVERAVAQLTGDPHQRK